MFKFGVERQFPRGSCPSAQASLSPVLRLITRGLQSRSVRESQPGGFPGQNSIMFLLAPGASSSIRCRAERLDSTCGQDNAWSLCWRCSILSTSLPNECIRPLAGFSRSDFCGRVTVPACRRSTAAPQVCSSSGSVSASWSRRARTSTPGSSGQACPSTRSASPSPRPQRPGHHVRAPRRHAGRRIRGVRHRARARQRGRDRGPRCCAHRHVQGADRTRRSHPPAPLGDKVKLGLAFTKVPRRVITLTLGMVWCALRDRARLSQ
jgi:hypothetical protein